MSRTLLIILTVSLVLLSLITANSNDAAAAGKLYDDFSSTYIDDDKWARREVVREVDGGKLILKMGNASGFTTEIAPGIFRNNVVFEEQGTPQSPVPIHAIECDVIVKKAILDGGLTPKSFVSVGGFFYKIQQTDNAIGDIYAHILIGNRGNNGLEIWWQVEETTAADGLSWTVIGSDTLMGPGTVDYDTSYNLKIAYTGGRNFTFSADNEEDSYQGPEYVDDPVSEFTNLNVGIDTIGSADSGFVSAVIDNVIINNQQTVFDDFSTSPLNQSKWNTRETVREISAQKLRLNLHVNGSRGGTKVDLKDNDTRYLEAKIMVESGSQLSEGAIGAARIAGWYYNASRGPGSGLPYNGNQGDVWVELRLYFDHLNNLEVNCYLWRADTPDDWGPGTSLFYQTFNTSIAFDTMYTLSIKQQGKKFIFKCNNETHEYTVDSAMYTPADGYYRQLLTRIYAGEGASGYVKAQYDDVYTDSTNMAPASMMLLNGD